MLETEINTELHRVKLALFASLESGPTGKILAGNLTELRIEAHENLVRSLVPYVQFTEEESGGGTDVVEDRQRFIERYKEWVAKGCPIKL